MTHPSISLQHPISLIMAALLVMGLANTTPVLAATPPVRNTAQVECRLPPQIRQLGRNTTYLAAGQQIRTTASECRVRGGQEIGGLDARAAGTAMARSSSQVPVMLGRHRDRCSSGVIAGLSPTGSLALREGPAATFARRARLANGNKVFLCDVSSDGRWLGIVTANGSAADCKVTIANGPGAYAGNCLSGWISARYVGAHGQ